MMDRDHIKSIRSKNRTFTDDILIAYSSRTGNTRKLAEGIAVGLARDGQRTRLVPIEEDAGAEKAGNARVVFLGFWARRGGFDDKALTYLQKLSGVRIGLFGTHGAYAASPHALKIAERVTALASERNTCLGCFTCQGKVDPELIKRCKKLPPDHPRALNEERIARHLEAAKHPNGEDIEAAVAACQTMLSGVPA
ncbi:MAG: flavodoxin family protein [Azoarcus sp.]|jgi:flavodoxin|nr:flavodoxin family protein [Azoarcus sp.]